MSNVKSTRKTPMSIIYGFLSVLLALYPMCTVAFVGPVLVLSRRSTWRSNRIFQSTFESSARTWITSRNSANASTSSNSSSNFDDDDNHIGDWNGDAYWLQQIQKQGEERPDYQWFKDRSSLPFECTACGKCCKTKGQVYMTPEEHEAAADLLGISKDVFLQHYASHTVIETTKNGEEHVWVRLLDQSSSSSSEDESSKSHGCIFLQEDNTCQIYEARPIQCSTYPFWPTILASRQAWNDEVRRADDDGDSSATSNINKKDLPPSWTSEGGGCEGMQRIGNAIDDEDEDVGSVGVPKEQAYEQAYWYEHDERRFPRSKEIPVEREEKS